MYAYYLFTCKFAVILEMEPTALYTLGKCFPTEKHPQYMDHLKKNFRLEMVVYSFKFSTWKHRQVDVFESESTVVYKVNARPAKTA